MGALIPAIIRIALQVLAGVGIGSVLDKVAADKVPNYQPVDSDINPLRPDFKPVKLIAFIVAFAAGAMLLKFIGKKLNIKLLK